LTTLDLCRSLLDVLRGAERGIPREDISCVLTAIRNAYVEHAAGVPHELSRSPVHLEVWPEDQQLWMRIAIACFAAWEGECDEIRRDSGPTDGV
jgi:hypothetical protein